MRISHLDVNWILINIVWTIYLFIPIEISKIKKDEICLKRFFTIELSKMEKVYIYMPSIYYSIGQSLNAYIIRLFFHFYLLPDIVLRQFTHTLTSLSTLNTTISMRVTVKVWPNCSSHRCKLLSTLLNQISMIYLEIFLVSIKSINSNNNNHQLTFFFLLNKYNKRF